MTRRAFLSAGAAAVAVAGGVTRTRAAGMERPVGPGLRVPDGAHFAGMAGAYSAMFTPFFRQGEKEGQLNEEAIERLVEYAVKTGLTGLYLTGSTGEGFLLSLDERKRVYNRAVKAAKGRLKLVAHVGCLNTDDACELARYAAKVGIDWVSSVAPVYFGQSFDAALDHYKTISEATDLPFMVYAVLGKLVPDQAARFFDLKNVCGMKYTGHDYYDLGALLRKLNKPAIFFAGADQQVLNGFATGEFAGCIGSNDNHHPRQFVKICALAAQGRFLEARPYHNEVCRYIDMRNKHGNIMSFHKNVMRYIGIDCGNPRRPAGKPLTQAEYDAFMAEVEALGTIRRNDANLI